MEACGSSLLNYDGLKHHRQEAFLLIHRPCYPDIHVSLSGHLLLCIVVWHSHNARSKFWSNTSLQQLDICVLCCTEPQEIEPARPFLITELDSIESHQLRRVCIVAIVCPHGTKAPNSSLYITRWYGDSDPYLLHRTLNSRTFEKLESAVVRIELRDDVEVETAHVLAAAFREALEPWDDRGILNM